MTTTLSNTYTKWLSSGKRIRHHGREGNINWGEACTECRRRKLKCDGQKPICEQCERGHRECRYERAAMKPASQALEEKLARLEDRLRDLEQSGPSAPTQVGDLNAPPEMAGRWWEPENLDPAVQTYLVDIFLRYRHHCLFNIHVERFVESLAGAGDRQPHRGLVEAVYLVACYFTARFHPAQSLRRHEEHFLARARNALTDSLSYSDRLHDFLRGSNIVAWYLFVKGRMLEAYHMNAGTARFALSCGLHRIMSPVFRDDATMTVGFRGISLLPPPSDQIELAERIFTWWQVYIWDKLSTVVTGFIGALPGDNHTTERIDTVFPREFEEYEAGNVTDLEYHTIEHLYKPDTDLTVTTRRPDTPFTVYIKAVTLWEHSIRLVGKVRAGGNLDDLRVTIDEVYQANLRLQEAMPAIIPLNDQSVPSTSTAEEESTSRQGYISKAITYTATYGTTIEVLNAIAHLEPGGYQLRLEAARSAVNLISTLTYDDFVKGCLIFGYTWLSVAKVLAEHIAVLNGQHSDAFDLRPALSATEKELVSVQNALAKLRETFPSLAFQEQELERALATFAISLPPQDLDRDRFLVTA